MHKCLSLLLLLLFFINYAALFQRSVSDHIWQKVEEKSLKSDILCGLPYQGIPLATVCYRLCYNTNFLLLKCYLVAFVLVSLQGPPLQYIQVMSIFI